MSETSAKALGFEGNDTEPILATILWTRSVTTKVIDGLVVGNIKEEDVMLDLPRTFTRNVIQANRNEIPRPNTICQMSHLKKISTEIPLYMVDIEVGLLIGLNCPGESFMVKNQTRMQFAHSSDGRSMVLSLLRNRMARLHATESMLVKGTL